MFGTIWGKVWKQFGKSLEIVGEKFGNTLGKVSNIIIFFNLQLNKKEKGGKNENSGCLC